MEIARDVAIKNDSALKVGDRFTVHYRMTATTIEPKSTEADTTKSTPPSPGLAPSDAKKKPTR